MSEWGVGVKSKAWEGRLSQTGALYRPQVVPTCVQRREGNANVLYRPPMAYCRVRAGDVRPRHGRSSAANDLANVAVLVDSEKSTAQRMRLSSSIVVTESITSTLSPPT